MNYRSCVSRRQFLQAAGSLLCLPLPGWAQSGRQGAGPVSYPGQYDLTVEETSATIAGRQAPATGVNGTMPGPLLRLKEGQPITLNVINTLQEDTSIHWHGLLLPYDMDGVPGISFAGIKPGETFRYRFDVVQNGTYWYHSHSGFQEQTGVVGPIIIDPVEPDPVEYDADFVVFLSDWTFEDPARLFANLKKSDDYYNRQRLTVSDLFDDADANGWPQTREERRMWGNMRMSATDIADVTGATYTFLMNGLDPARNWTGIFSPGDRVRLRFINGSAMTFFNVRIPGLEMTVVQCDGQNVDPIPVDEFQIGVAETYDVIVQPKTDQAYAIFAESMDRSGFARGTLAPRIGMSAPVPELRERPLLTKADMGMDHSSMGGHNMHSMEPAKHDHILGPGVSNITMNPVSRLDEPGIGLDNAGHRVLTYADLKSQTPNPDQRAPQRELELHLTGNMRRYMWSFDGVKFSEVEGPIHFQLGERLRLVLVNDTMMAHPIHLHGMFVELVNGNDEYNPRKHTLVVKPGERLMADITADAPGLWAFHCHMLYHMKGGMMRAVAVVTSDENVT